MHVEPELHADLIGTVLKAEKLINDALHGRPDLAQRLLKGLLRTGKDLTVSPTTRDEAPAAVCDLDENHSSVDGGEFNQAGHGFFLIIRVWCLPGRKTSRSAKCVSKGLLHTGEDLARKSASNHGASVVAQ
jgi:hypothetical protein